MLKSNIKIIPKNMFTKAQFDKMVSGVKKIIIVSHIGPDPDALASALSILWYIEKEHKHAKAKVYMEASPKVGMTYIPMHAQIKFRDNISTYLNKAELVIFVDAPGMDRFTHFPTDVDQCNYKSIHFDHHPPNGEEYDLNFVDQSAAAATQLIAETLLMDYLSDPILSRILLYGICADTGTFRYLTPKTARVLSLTEEIIKQSGVDLQEIDLHLSSYTLEELEIIGEFMKNTKNVKLKNSRFGLTYSYISKDIYSRGFRKELVKRAKNNYQFSYLRRIDQHPWGFVIVPQPDLQSFRVSLRSIPGAPNVQFIAETLKGGGHEMAASGKFESEGKDIDSEEVSQIVLKIIEKLDLVPVVAKDE